MSPSSFRLVAFIRLGRPLFLVGGFVLYGLGAAAAARAGAVIDVWLYLWGQLAVTAFQLMTHYANDYYDFDGDRLNVTPTRWSGGSRVLVAGQIPRGAALLAALALLVVGLGALALLRATGRAGPLATPTFLTMLLLSWEYSAPPLRLHATGFGELTVAAVVTALVPVAGFYLQSPTLVGMAPLLLGLVPLACLQVAMLLAIEFPDAAADAAVGKRTLVVRLGPRLGAVLYVLLIVAAYLALPVLLVRGLPGVVAVAVAVGAPLGVWRIVRVLEGDWREPGRWEGLAFWSVALLVGTSVAELLAFLT